MEISRYHKNSRRVHVNDAKVIQISEICFISLFFRNLKVTHP